MSMAKAYRIAVTDEELTLLKRKLELSRFPDELEQAGWDYGAPLTDIKRLAARWKEGYDWRKYEAELNVLPMFTRDIAIDDHGTLNIHYVHQQSMVKNAIPLLFVHGWPGSFIEVRKIISLLTASSPDHPSFHVVALSLPGYAFSEAPRKKGFSGPQYAELGHKLMLSLGYEEYVTQGGDWGHYVTRFMAYTYGPKNVKAWHTNFPAAMSPPRLFSHPRAFLSHLFSCYSPQERLALQRSAHMISNGRGYTGQQSTQPQTLGYSLSDSPIGLLAWIYEKLVAWTDAYQWEDDEVLTWISIYWFSRAGPTAATRIYYEVGKTGGFLAPPRPAIPMGVSYFPKDMYQAPQTWLRVVGNPVFVASHSEGGHFAAYERPSELVGDLRKMYARGGPAYGIVQGKDGY